MKKLFYYFIIFIIFISNSFAYIDPGTGGYLLSTIWSYIIGILVIIFGSILRFFRVTLKNFIFKNKFLSILYLSIIIIILFSIYFLFFNININSKIPLYDEKLNGVQINIIPKATDSYKLYNGNLINNSGDIIKTWNYSYLSILDLKGNYYGQNGYESIRFGKFTFEDEPIWIKDIPIHHEIYVNDDKVITFTKEVHIYNDRNVEFDVILIFNSSNGNLIFNWSTWDNLDNLKQFHKPLSLDTPKNVIIPEKDRKNTSIWGGNYDYYHLNSFSLVPENDLENFHPAFKKGNWIISFRHGSMIFILDKDTQKVLWFASYNQIENNLEGQHSVKMLKNGNLLIFDNGRYREWSRIIELNTITLDLVKEYKSEDFFSLSQGYIDILSNNNYLITESEKGRIFELNKEFEIVWEYFEPSFYNESDGKIFRTQIYRSYSYEKDFINNILEKN